VTGVTPRYDGLPQIRQADAARRAEGRYGIEATRGCAAGWNWSARGGRRGFGPLPHTGQPDRGVPRRRPRRGPGHVEAGCVVGTSSTARSFSRYTRTRMPEASACLAASAAPPARPGRTRYQRAHGHGERRLAVTASLQRAARGTRGPGSPGWGPRAEGEVPSTDTRQAAHAARRCTNRRSVRCGPARSLRPGPHAGGRARASPGMSVRRGRAECWKTALTERWLRFKIRNQP